MSHVWDQKQGNSWKILCSGNSLPPTQVTVVRVRQIGFLDVSEAGSVCVLVFTT